MEFGTNKEALKTMNEKYRSDALRDFISGLNRPIGNILFSSRPADLSSALALAQELDMNQQRFAFANAFAERGNKHPQIRST